MFQIFGINPADLAINLQGVHDFQVGSGCPSRAGDTVFLRQQQEEVIAMSAFDCAEFRVGIILDSSSIAFRLCRHSASPCKAHTLSGWWLQR
jgi:hypothetical protein